MWCLERRGEMVRGEGLVMGAVGWNFDVAGLVQVVQVVMMVCSCC
jgi:hypothetical protein